MRSVVALLLALTARAAYAQSETDLRACTEMAQSVSKIFAGLQAVDAQNPGKREETVEMARQAAYERYSQQMKEKPSFAVVWDVQRMYANIAIKHLIALPTAQPIVVERQVFETCINDSRPRR